MRTVAHTDDTTGCSLTPRMSLIKTALSSLRWSVLGELTSRAVGPVVFLVLARILVPADFGVVAAATVVIGFSQVFWDAGLAQALIQRKHDLAKCADVVFWVNVAAGIATGIVLFC